VKFAINDLSIFKGLLLTDIELKFGVNMSDLILHVFDSWLFVSELLPDLIKVLGGIYIMVLDSLLHLLFGLH
jgi:hypothetical protein